MQEPVDTLPHSEVPRVDSTEKLFKETEKETVIQTVSAIYGAIENYGENNKLLVPELARLLKKLDRQEQALKAARKMSEEGQKVPLKDYGYKDGQPIPQVVDLERINVENVSALLLGSREITAPDLSDQVEFIRWLGENIKEGREDNKKSSKFSPEEQRAIAILEFIKAAKYSKEDGNSQELIDLIVNEAKRQTALSASK